MFKSLISDYRLNLRAKKFHKIIANSRKPMMFFDSDTDGATAYLQIRQAFPHVKGYFMPKDFDKQVSRLEVIAGNDLVIIFDIPVLKEEFLQGLKDRGVKTIIWADHHPSNDKKLIKKFGIVHLNPLEFHKFDNRPASYLAFLVSGRLEKNLFWASLGSVADFFLLDVLLKFEKFDEKNFKVLFGGLSEKKKKEIFEFVSKHKFYSKSVMSKREELIKFLSFETNLSKFKNFFDFLFKIEDLEIVMKAFREIEKMLPAELLGEILAGKEVPFSSFNEMTLVYKKLLAKALKKRDCELFVFEASGDTAFTKTLSEELAYRLKKWRVVCVAFNKSNSNSYRISLRGKNFLVNVLAQKSVVGISGQGGGHPYAAGVSVKKSDFKQFLKNLKKNFKVMLKEENK